MADKEQNDENELIQLLECPICMSVFTDPRMLSCIHTFCFECLNHTAEANQKKQGDKMPCPLCRKDFTIPADGVNGIPKNFFMENLSQLKTTLQMGSVSVICDICYASDVDKTGQVKKATVSCLECQDNYCDSCIKVHQFQKLSRNHRIEQIPSGNQTSRMAHYFDAKYCTKHPQKQLEYFCTDCKKIVCVSCFVESHSSHKCKDVTTLDKEYRKTIEEKTLKISALKNEISSLRSDQEKRKSDFLKEIENKEKEILERNQEVKRMIDQHTQSLVNKLSVIKSNHLKEIENQMEEIDRCCIILRSFEFYCSELRLKGSAVDICISVDQLIVRADELERDHEEFIGRPHQSVELSFQATDLSDAVQNSNGNLVGNIKECWKSACEERFSFQQILDVLNAPGSIKLEKETEEQLRSLPDFIELTTEPDMITLGDDPNTMRAKMPCGHIMGSIKLEGENEEQLRPLPGFIELTTEPDMITCDDDPGTMRAKMPCGHIIGTISMKCYVQTMLKDGKFKFGCPAYKCDREWPYFLVRHVACLSNEETQEIEKKLTNNFLQTEYGCQMCPGCNTWCLRAKGVGNCVCCPICTTNSGRKFAFCWVCLGEWKRFRFSRSCGNSSCDKMDNRKSILANCSTKSINFVIGCPIIRACPKCRLLLQHHDKCGHMSCHNCGCRFCFVCLKECINGKYQCHFLSPCKVAPRQES